MEYVSPKVAEQLGEKNALILEEFCVCLEANKNYGDPLEVVKILFDVYALNGSSKWVIPPTANAISKEYKEYYNNPYYTSDILSNMKAMLI